MLNRHIRETIDTKFEEKIRELTKEQQKSQNRQPHKTIDTHFQAKVWHQLQAERQLESKHTAQLEELKAENKKLRNELDEMKMSVSAIICGCFIYLIGWEKFLGLVWILLIILCCPCLCVFALIDNNYY